MNDIPSKILAKAYARLADVLESKVFPGDVEDWWEELDEGWDLCFYTDESDDPPDRYATIYQVVDGNTQTQTYKRIFESNYVDMGIKEVTVTVPHWFASYLEVNLLPLEIEWLLSDLYPGNDGAEKAKSLEQVQEVLATEDK